MEYTNFAVDPNNETASEILEVSQFLEESATNSEALKAFYGCLICLGYDKQVKEKDLDSVEYDFAQSWVTKILVDKLRLFGAEINIPKWGIMFFEICSNGNPGLLQVIYKELLTNINQVKFNNHGIPKGYTITTDDIKTKYPKIYPMLQLKYKYQQYEKLWDEQKLCTPTGTINAVDTADYWLSVMEGYEE